MKKEIATLLRRVAQKLDPQKPEVTGYARKVVDFIPYSGIEIYRRLLLAGNDDEARNLKASMRALAEVMANGRLHDVLTTDNIIHLEHNFGHVDREINGIKCQPGGATVVIELKGSWS